MRGEMGEEDVALVLADPDYAASLGIELPRCQRCGGTIKAPPLNWDGRTALVHLIPLACDWEATSDE